MDDLTRLLHDADPLAREPELSSGDAALIRQRVVSAAHEPAAGGSWSWRVTLAFAMVALLAAVGTIFDSRSRRGQDGVSSVALEQPSPAVPKATPTTQVQFETPGGTRIVWVLNPDLNF